MPSKARLQHRRRKTGRICTEKLQKNTRRLFGQEEACELSRVSIEMVAAEDDAEDRRQHRARERGKIGDEGGEGGFANEDSAA